MKQGRLIEFCQENALVIANTLFQQYKRINKVYLPEVPIVLHTFISQIRIEELFYARHKGKQPKTKFESSMPLTTESNTLFQHHKRKLYTWTSPDGEH